MPELTISRVFDTLRPVDSGDGVTAIERVGLGMATVMVRRGKSGEFLQQVKRRLGIELADAPKRYRFDRTSLIGTGNGKWLAVCETPTANFMEELQRELDGLASVVDQSHAFGVLRLSGSALLAALEKGVQIDLSSDAFPVGRAAVTNIAHIGVNLWKVDDAPTFDIAVTRSFAGSFCHWLEASAAIHGFAVHRRPL
ncbi:MAG: Sarcosine oxidase, gamma subunit [Bradyrhizobium sp.]|nr:Sarcosine oxidase, gamma subunit [Bradyrhizobium sp.]